MVLSAPELEIFGVYDRGVPNLERIVLRANVAVNLRYYAVLLGYKAPYDTVYPIADQFLWLGAINIEVPSWVFIYTGLGTPGISQEQHTKDPIHALYWNKPQVIFSNADVVPALIRMDHIEIGNKEPRTVQSLITKTVRDDIAETIRKYLANQSGKGS